MIATLSQTIDNLFVRYVRGPEHPCKLRLVGWLVDRWFKHVTVITESGRMALDSEDLIQRALLYYGHFEPVTFKLHRSLLKYGDTYVDVGSNVGTFSLLASQCVGPAGQVIAIDPNPFVFSRLLKNLALNPEFSKNVVPVCTACSGEDGVARLLLPPSANCGLGHITVSESDNTFVIGTRRLSGLLDSLNVRHIALMKIDVEGHEYPILEELFSRKIFPANLIFEYLPNEFPGHRDLPKLLNDSGYQINSLDGHLFDGCSVEENNLWAVFGANLQ